MWKKKAKYYITLYIMGYVFSLFATGVPSLIYLVPVKGIAVIIMVASGSALYRVIEEKENYLLVCLKSLKNILFSLLILLILFFMYSVLLKFGIDITPFIGIP
ncbi:hypothetical protein SAMN05421736_10895 [Evansella caseinilytica]|uniref:Uncharacterized protein n=1 Tax=Evansella caseinilytica TaxID=1503961 RepID=A0A1H3RGJ6_9BACI|nr:hypothetical protein [Evansella caseinilytica]SDZ24817.1 hypothetical protein SAMN05421736_10895 [Evansella caseinilytica]